MAFIISQFFSQSPSLLHSQTMLLPLIFLILANLSAFVQSQSVCLNNGNYTSNSTYKANLDTVLSSLPTNVHRNGFYNASFGQNPDRANAIVLCRGDIQLDTCRGCVRDAAAALLASCPNQKQAVNWQERCTLRYSNETLVGILATMPGYYWWNPENATSVDQFKEDLSTLLDDLRGQAVYGGSLRKVAAGNITGPDFQRIFALVQCSPDLSPEDCSSCLIGAAADIPKCCDRKRGGRVLRPSCTLRFEIYPFYNGTRLEELVPRPEPPVWPPPEEHGGNTARTVKDDGNSNTTRTVIIITVSVAAGVILVVSVGIFLIKRIKQKPKDSDHIESEVVDDISTPESLQFAFSTIRDATNNFSDNNKLGQGGFGTVYKGKFLNGQEIAVKRLSKNSGQGDLEFKNEVLLLARLQHRNLVKLLGFSLQGEEKLLVYEFVQNASLDLFIFDPINHSYLDWERRHKIIGGIARGILYLHEDSRLRIIHRDLKASNVLLDGNMNPKIADFGMARLCGHDETQGNTNRIVGTYGYMAPEYAIHGQFSVKSDVFSFGVLVLEIISGQKNNCFRSGENVEDLLSFAWKNWREGTAANVVDPVLRSGAGSMTEMLRCIHIGLLCVQENASDRPTMASVVLMLSSFSLTLGVPSEPAFYVPSGYGSDVPHFQEYNSIQSDHSSRNDASITDLHPR
ncbi:putative receptor-like protein kinase At4g00960 [Sesamum indicum]|uniref:Receptor-like protein kinase At4g00960 n=1 Tax=Sesamum indicum TaxID=4182 RepID=A0A6I9T3H7_SESIN|nr:putative receptor-like protein kinase At4g00960 [Sesamum indicum]